jgi:hypothetical protein
VSIIFRTFGFLALTALILIIPGGLLGTHVSPDQAREGMILRRVSAGILAGLYVALFLAHLGCWTYRLQMRNYRFKVRSQFHSRFLCLHAHTYAIHSFWLDYPWHSHSWAFALHMRYFPHGPPQTYLARNLLQTPPLQGSIPSPVTGFHSLSCHS